MIKSSADTFCDLRAIGFIFLVCLISSCNVRANTGYLVVVPSALRPATEEVISVTILRPSEPILVEAKLFSKAGELITETGHEIFGKGTLQLKIPRDAKGKCTLKICGNCMAAGEGRYTFYNSTLIVVEEKGTSVFIQTDKPIYKPGQQEEDRRVGLFSWHTHVSDVKNFIMRCSNTSPYIHKAYINIITTDPELRPVNEKLLAYIEDPRGSRMMQWKDLQPPCCGLANISYPISEQPLLGTWTVIVELQGHVYNRTFEIQKYVLPRYDVIIDPPRFIRDWRKCEIVYVRAKYTFGKRVSGSLTMSATVKGVGYYKEYLGLTTVRSMQIQGVAAVNVCIHQIMSWNVGDHFRGLLHIEALVTTPDGASVKVSDSSCPVNKHLIDLEFTKDTRPYFKPGLPYKGRLRVMYPDSSPADNITVRVQADVNGENFVARDYVSDGGIINFDVPALPTLAQSVWLEAKVMKIGPDVVHEHYFPTYMSIGSWYSPSKCHTLIVGQPGEHKVGEVAKFYVHSTCPCNFTMYYEVMARGNLVHSGIHFARHVQKRSVQFQDLGGQITFDHHEDEAPVEQEYGDAMICTIFVKFGVTHQMAPVSRLLVYYVKENGEGVADSVTFRVRPQYRNHLSVGVSTREATPGGMLNLHVSTSPGSHVCVSAVDKSVHLLRPDYQLSTEDVFSELEQYDLTVRPATDVQWWVRPRSRRHRRSLPWWPAAPAKDAHYAFEECGLIVMTDKVRLHFRQDMGTYTGPLVHRPGPGYYQVASFAGPKHNDILKIQMAARRKTRSFFPETWIWRCFNASTNTVVPVRAPDTVTTWQVEGVSLSPTRGLALTDPVQLRTFKAFFVHFNLPHSVIRGEQVKIPLTIYNYLHSCVRVHLKLLSPDGVTVVPTQDSKHLQKLCVGSEETRTVTTVFVFSGLGSHTLSAEANAYADNRCCSGMASHSEYPSEVIGHDLVANKILCEPEGVRQEYTHSVFFCPNERIHLTTPNKYEFQYVKKPEAVRSVTFSARAHNDLRVSLSALSRDNENMYEIVIGGWSNTQSWIALGKEGEKLAEAETKNIVSEEEFRMFWVSWQKGEIKVGYGDDPSNDTAFVTYTTNQELVVTYVGFSTGWGSDGEFRIWKRSEMDGRYGKFFQLNIPENAISGSEKAEATIVGDVMGPTLQHVHRLVSLPYGCGEQNMVHFAPNTYVLRYLDRTGQLTTIFKEKAVEYLIKGYQRQLTYRRDDGSYSAFGERDSSGNMWLTAFVLKSFAQAREFIYIDEKELGSSIAWILGQQRRDGHFPPTGRLINKQIKGGVQGKISLTAFVTTALLEAGLASKQQKTSIISAKKYLETHLPLVVDPYTTALTAYTLSLLKSSHAVTMLKQLKQQSVNRDGFTFWKLEGAKRQGKDDKNGDDIKRQVSAAEIEVASYGLLTLVAHGHIASALSVVKWLSKQRNPLGGFQSTQDTCVALQSLSEYAALAYSGHLNLTVSLASTNMDLQQHFELNEDTSDVSHTAPIPTIPTGIFVSAVGEGCALMQIEVSYHVADPSGAPAFSIDIRLGKQRRAHRNRTRKTRDTVSPGSPIEDFKVTIETCTRWRHAGSSNMAVLEVSLLTGFHVDETTLDELLGHGHLKLKRYEVEDRKVLLYFDEIQSGCLTCVSFETYRMHVVGKTQPVPVRIYDYYEPGYEATTFYNASHIGQLTEELCEDEVCNEIREDVDMPEADNNCNSIFGCYGSTTAGDRGLERCSCYRDCHRSGPKVCGSDGRLHHNLCRLEVEACRGGKHVYVVPMHICNRDSDTGSGELSGDGDSTSGDVTPLAPFTPLDDEAGNTSVTTIGPEQSERPDGHQLEDVADHPDPVTPNPGQGSFTDMISDDYTTETPRPSTPPANSDYGFIGEGPVPQRVEKVETSLPVKGDVAHHDIITIEDIILMGERRSNPEKSKDDKPPVEVGPLGINIYTLNAVTSQPQTVQDTQYQSVQNTRADRFGKEGMGSENETFGKAQSRQNGTNSEKHPLLPVEKVPDLRAPSVPVDGQRAAVHQANDRRQHLEEVTQGNDASEMSGENVTRLGNPFVDHIGERSKVLNESGAKADSDGFLNTSTVNASVGQRQLETGSADVIRIGVLGNNYNDSSLPSPPVDIVDDSDTDKQERHEQVNNADNHTNEDNANQKYRSDQGLHQDNATMAILNHTIGLTDTGQTTSESVARSEELETSWPDAKTTESTTSSQELLGEGPGEPDQT